MYSPSGQAALRLRSGNRLAEGPKRNLSMAHPYQAAMRLRWTTAKRAKTRSDS